MSKHSFLRTFAELRKGIAVTDASNHLAFVKAVRKTGRTGELNIKLEIRPHADGETITIEDTIAPKAPRKATNATDFFDGEDGTLVRETPARPERFDNIEGDQSEVVAVAMVGSMVLLALAVRTISLATAYAIWVSLGIAATAVAQATLLKQPLAPLQVLFLGMLLVAVVGLKVTAK